MDISKLRKKHKEGKDKPESKKAERRPEDIDKTEEPEEELQEELAEDLEAAAKAEESAAEAEAEDEIEDEYVAPPADVSPPKPKVSVPEEEIREGKTGELVELVTFTLGEEYYAFRVTGVNEVLRPQYVAIVPRAVDFIVGVTSLRGKIIPVMDLRKRLNVGGETGKAANIVILKGVGKGVIGAMVDRTHDVIKVQEGEIKPPPSHLGDAEARFLEGVTVQEDKFISVINPHELLDFNAWAEGI